MMISLRLLSGDKGAHIEELEKSDLLEYNSDDVQFTIENLLNCGNCFVIPLPPVMGLATIERNAYM